MLERVGFNQVVCIVMKVLIDVVNYDVITQLQLLSGEFLIKSRFSRFQVPFLIYSFQKTGNALIK